MSRLSSRFTILRIRISVSSTKKKHCNENAHIGNRENEDSCRPYRGRAWSARVVGSRRNRSDNIWTPKSKIYIFHNIEIIIFRVSLLGFGENGDRRWGNDGWMMQRKYTPLPIPIKSLCTNFESKPSKTKVVSSVQLQNQGLDLLTQATNRCSELSVQVQKQSSTSF